MTSVSSDASGISIGEESGSCFSETETGSRATEVSEAEKEELAQKETEHVLMLRVLVVLVLLLAAVAVSIVVYTITENAEIDEFETQYTALSETVLRTFEEIVTEKMGAISSVSVAAIAHGVDHHREWPFVTLSFFQERSATARSLSGALSVSINPVVSDAQRSEWEKFVVEEEEDHGWITDGQKYQKDLEIDGFEPDHALVEGDTSWTHDINQTRDRDEIYYIDEGEYRIDPGPGPYLQGTFPFPAASQHSKSFGTCRALQPLSLTTSVPNTRSSSQHGKQVLFSRGAW
jgi:hypothetical protein